MSALEKLLLYDHNALLIAMNRNTSEEDEENDIHYDDLKAIDQKTLTRYARQASEFGRADILEGEKYEDLTEDRIEKLSGIAREILSEYTGKDKAYFDVLTLKEMADYAYDIHDLLDKEYAGEAKKKCIDRVEELNNRIAMLDDAVKEFDRKKISAVIHELTGIEEDELRKLLTEDLFDMANSFSDMSVMKIR